MTLPKLLIFLRSIMATEQAVEPSGGPNLRQRPLSPHLSIYRWHLSMVMSILHRMTGVALVFGALIPAWLIIAAALGVDIYSATTHMINTPIGYVLLLGWTLAFYYHLFNGIRHIFWDFGLGFALKTAQRNGILVLIFTLLATAATWYLALHG